MNYKKIFIRFLIPILSVIAIASIVLLLQNDKKVKIDEWSSGLVADKIEWAQVVKGYGSAKCSYDIPTDEYNELIALLKTVTDKAKKESGEYETWHNDYYLAIQYEQKTWLFKCLYNGHIFIVFNDYESAKYYGDKNANLYIDCPELWNYIVNTVDTKAK